MNDADVERQLVSVLSAHWVFALATHDPDLPTVPYPTPLFFAHVDCAQFGGAGPGLVFVSDPSTRHGIHLGTGPTAAAGAVYLETDTVGQIRGAQLRGAVVRADTLGSNDPDRQTRLREAYLARHPIAAGAFESERPPSLYLFAIRWAKLTDNRLGFGVHPTWSGNDGWLDA